MRRDKPPVDATDGEVARFQAQERDARGHHIVPFAGGLAEGDRTVQERLTTFERAGEGDPSLPVLDSLIARLTAICNRAEGILAVLHARRDAKRKGPHETPQPPIRLV
jgi:hypothetical protein